jgi:hypothetical protein
VLRQDFIGRLIHQLVESLGRVTRLVEEQKLDDADGELDSAEQALGLPRGMERFDAKSAALLVGGSDKVVLAALVLEHRARIAALRGDAKQARRHRGRAFALLEHAKPNELESEAAALRERLISEARAS